MALDETVTVSVPAGVDKKTAQRAIERAMADLATRGKIDAVLAASPTRPRAGQLAQAALREERWRDIEAEWGMLTAADVAALTGSRPEATRNLTANLRRRKHLTGVKRHGGMRYPGFQFTGVGEGAQTVAPAWTELHELLAPAQWSNADLLAWTAAPNAYLDGGRSPAEEIRDHPDGVTDALRYAAVRATPASPALPVQGSTADSTH